MLQEEAESFSQTDDDVGQAEELQLEINLTDSVSLQKRYNSILRPLHAEVKQYVQDLLNRCRIQKSRSAYSSPVVCVRKRDGSLRLCIDYQQLNAKTIRDRRHYRVWVEISGSLYLIRNGLIIKVL